MSATTESAPRTHVAVPPMDKYRLAPRAQEDKGSAQDDLVRVQRDNQPGSYVKYAMSLFEEKNLDSCTFRGSGSAIPMAIQAANILKYKMGEVTLYQRTNVGTTRYTEVYEPLEEGLEKIERPREVAYIEIIISKNADSLKKGFAKIDTPTSEEIDSFLKDNRSLFGRRRRGNGFRRGRGRATRRTSASQRND